MDESSNVYAYNLTIQSRSFLLSFVGEPSGGGSSPVFVAKADRKTCLKNSTARLIKTALALVSLH